MPELELHPEEVAADAQSIDQIAELVARCPAMRRLVELIRKIAPLDVPVVIHGETGTGKKQVARAIHRLSPRCDGPLVVVDFRAMAPEFVDRELFGQEGGHPGAFERAHRGTILLDGLAELPLDFQPKLVRVLESHELRRLRGSEAIALDMRIIAASDRDLAAEVSRGRFRADLYYRLSVIHLALPPLRRRREDIPALLHAALEEPELAARSGRKILAPDAVAALSAYAWPGNVRELKNVVWQVVASSDAEAIRASHLPPYLRSRSRSQPALSSERLLFKDAKEQLLQQFEREYLIQLLRRCDGNLSHAARESGLHRKSIERLVSRYQLDPRRMKPVAGVRG
jgi:DNA-binding NtrC family response regulator